MGSANNKIYPGAIPHAGSKAQRCPKCPFPTQIPAARPCVADNLKRPTNTIGRPLDGSDFRALWQEESVFDIDTEIADRVLDLGVPQQNLDRPDVACGPIDHCGFCPPKRMRSVFRLPKTNRSHPFINQAGILARAHVSGMINPAWEKVIARRTAPSFQLG